MQAVYPSAIACWPGSDRTGPWINAQSARWNSLPRSVTETTAGAYRVSLTTPVPGVLAIRGAHAGAFLVSPKPESDNATASPRLVFNRYRDQYFLRVVRYADRSYTLPETMQEREASTRRNGMQASIPEVVAIQASLSR